VSAPELFRVPVHPYDPADVAAAIARALDVPPAERQRRHAALLRRLRAGTAGDWAARFTAALAEAPRPTAPRRAGAPPRGRGS
jgi:trehalose-6-phosphate synthase